jgi:hypothetical protein
MKNFLALLFVLTLSLALAVPVPQQITIELGQPFAIQGVDSATFADMTFRLESVNMTGENPQVLVTVIIGEESEGLMLELPAAASVEVGEYTLTLQGAKVPEDSSMSCAVSSATLVLEKTQAAM